MHKKCIFWEARAPSERGSAVGSFCLHREVAERLLIWPSTAGPQESRNKGAERPGPSASPAHTLTAWEPVRGPSFQRRPGALCRYMPWGAICLSHSSLGFSFEQIPPSQWSWPDWAERWGCSVPAFRHIAKYSQLPRGPDTELGETRQRFHRAGEDSQRAFPRLFSGIHHLMKDLWLNLYLP